MDLIVEKDNMPCIKHNYRPVNNRYYLTGELVPEGADWGDGKSEWVTEIRCEVCDKKFEEPRWKTRVNINSPSLITGHLFAVVKK